MDLYDGDAARTAAGAPTRDVSRPGLALLVEQGRQFEREKFNELAQAFPGRVVHGTAVERRPGEERAFGEIRLADHLDRCRPGTFLVEAEYEVEAPFIEAHALRELQDGSAFGQRGARLRFANVRPDILHVVPTDGRPRQAVTPAGDIVGVGEDDGRLGLRIIDVKLTGEPSPAHFAELAYYAMTLAAWLQHTGRADRFIVLKDAAIWPGKHEASELRRLESQDRRDGVVAAGDARYLEGLERDLETIPAEVVIGHVRQFLRFELRETLLAPDWRALPWFVDSACMGCDYLGYDWRRAAEETDDLPEGTDLSPYCWTNASATGHLSMVTGLTRGACGKLREQLVENISQLSGLSSSNRVFEQHQKLRAGRSLFQARSQVLATGAQPCIPDRAGTSAILPAWSDIRVALSIDYDVGSGLTFAIGYQLVAFVPNERVQEGQHARFNVEVRRDQPRIMFVEEKSLAAERDVIVEVMRRLVEDIDNARQQIETARRALGQTDRERDALATLQIYLWDRLNFDHLCRVTGRHLLDLLAPPAGGTGPRVAPMAWLFPAEQVIEDAEFTTVNSPVSVVGDAVQALLAADVPHHYALLSVANAYHPPRFDREDGRLPFRQHPFFHDPLSDQIPSERGHEVWNRRSPFRRVDYQAYRNILRRAVRTKLDAVLAVAERLTDDLRGSLSAKAPSVRSVFDPVQPLGAVSTDGQILYQHGRLMAAADALKVGLLMAMPPHQREAAFESVRLEHRYTGAQRRAELDSRGLGHWLGDPGVLVFRMSERSTQAKIKEGDFDWSLMPEARLPLQHRTIAILKSDFPTLQALLGPPDGSDHRTRLREACKVDVVVFDRVTRTVVLRTDRPILPALVQTGLFDFGLDPARGLFAALDPLSIDWFVRPRLRPALRAIRVPPLSRSRPLFRSTALTRVRLPNPRQSASVPAERFLWDADRLAAEPSGRSADAALAAIEPHGRFTPRQKDAVRQAVGRRLSLLWGPPGTGKSTTAAALIHGLLAEARQRRAGLRLAVTGPTWVAIDTVARRLPGVVSLLGLAADVRVARLASREPGPDGVAPELRDHLILTDGGTEHLALRTRLADPSLTTLIAGTAHQLAKLTEDEEHSMSPLFDVMLIDEASQMSVAMALVAFTTLAEGASVAVMGDDKQMPPIQPVPPPEGAEHLVGSIYDFYRRYRQGEPEATGIEPVMLDRSFRSNREIVEFVRLAGYGDDLISVQPDLRMRLASPVPLQRPSDWPESVPWHPHLATVLDPEEPLVAVVHPDPYSSQRNDGEADLVAGLVLSLMGHLQPASGGGVLSAVELFRDGLGIITPHRAQQAAIVERLTPLLGSDAERAAMMASVDTVERFQGQEKTVMVASFGLGDRDQIGAEEEFLYSLNRFNVIASRARAKLIVVLSRRLVHHLPRDPEVLRASRLLKYFADGYLYRSLAASIPGLGACEIKLR